MRLTLYYREGCHLCDDMEFSLRDLIAHTNWSIHKVDIDLDETLRQRFNADVPVLYAGEKFVCRHFLDIAVLGSILGENH
jgi:hypothetical protein